MDNEKQRKKRLEKYKGQIPSRAQLGLESMFGVTQAERDAATALLKLLPPEDPQEWATSAWKVGFPPEEIMKLSEAGRLTLEMFKNQPLSGAPHKAGEPVEGPADAQVVTNAAMPAIEDDGINEHLKQLNWPPKPTPQPPQPKPEEPPRDNLWPRFVAGRPSEPDKSLRPISDEAFSNN
jgi:hypothetical protein